MSTNGIGIGLGFVTRRSTIRSALSILIDGMWIAETSAVGFPKPTASSIFSPMSRMKSFTFSRKPPFSSSVSIFSTGLSDEAMAS
ncbi:hypothetical protein AMTRI_Chr13g124410 [Amborella trichopoda]